MAGVAMHREPHFAVQRFDYDDVPAKAKDHVVLMRTSWLKHMLSQMFKPSSLMFMVRTIMILLRCTQSKPH